MKTERYCCRCSRELTDAASMEVGIGPVCRKLDNALLAITFERDIPRAQRASARLSLGDWGKMPEALPTAKLVIDALHGKSTDDWRVEVKRIEWLLSFPQVHREYREAFCEIADALGYGALANVWRHGVGVAGKASVRFGGGRFFVKGPRNGAAVGALREIPGRQWHPAEKEWSVPSKSFDAFRRVVSVYYPVNDAQWEALLALADSTPSVDEAPAKKASPAAVLRVLGQCIIVSTPFNADFVRRVRELPQRRWDAERRAWVFGIAMREQIEAIVRECYGDFATA